MTWVKLDDGFTEHPKVIQAGKLAAMLFVDGLCYSARQLTDGFIPNGALDRFGYGRHLKEAVASLLEVGLWTPCEGGHQVHDYLDFQQSASSVKAERSAAKERMQRLRSGKVRANNHRSSPEVREQDPGKIPVRPLEAKASKSLSGSRASRRKECWSTWDDLSEDEQAEIFAYAGHLDGRVTMAWVVKRVNVALNQAASRTWTKPMQGLQNAIRGGVERGELNAPAERFTPRGNGNPDPVAREAERKAWVAAQGGGA